MLRLVLLPEQQTLVEQLRLIQLVLPAKQPIQARLQPTIRLVLLLEPLILLVEQRRYLVLQRHLVPHLIQLVQQAEQLIQAEQHRMLQPQHLIRRILQHLLQRQYFRLIVVPHLQVQLFQFQAPQLLDKLLSCLTLVITQQQLLSQTSYLQTGLISQTLQITLLVQVVLRLTVLIRYWRLVILEQQLLVLMLRHKTIKY